MGASPVIQAALTLPFTVLKGTTPGISEPEPVENLKGEPYGKGEIRRRMGRRRV